MAEHAKPGLSRRRFLTGAGIAAGAAAFSLSGCNASGSEKTAPAEKSSEKAKDVQSDKDAEKAKKFAEFAAPIDPVAKPASWDGEYDAIVVGSGGGGCNAALRLSENGMKVLMIERLSEFGGISKHSSMFSNVGGHKIAEANKWAFPEYPYNVDKIVECFYNAQQMSGDPELLRAMAIEGPKCIDWMIDAVGCKWVPSNPSPSGAMLLVWEGQKTKTNGVNVNFETFRYLREKVEEAGVELKLKTKVLTLVSENNEILGVKVEEEGAEKFYGAKYTILTAGGMETNRAMMETYNPLVTKGIANIATPPYGTGECIRMGMGVGATLSGMDSTGAFEGGIWWKEYEPYDTMMDTRINKDGNQAVRQPWLRINKLGERVPYISVTSRAYPYVHDQPISSEGLCETGNIEMSQPDGKTFVVFDNKYDELLSQNYFQQAICRVAGTVAPDDPYIDRVPEELRDWRTGFNDMVEKGAIKKCDTIEELEKALGLEEGVLTSNVEKWNEACDKGEDYVNNYKYKPEWLIKLDTPPYYGAAVGGHVFGSKCGLTVNPNMQVINEYGKAIKGLYAGWHTAGGSAGEGNFAARPLTGMYADIGLSFVGGYMCAEGVLKEEKGA